MINLTNIQERLIDVTNTDFGITALYEDKNYETNGSFHHIQVVNRTDNKLDIQVMSLDKSISKCVNSDNDITCTVIDKLINLFKLI